MVHDLLDRTQTELATLAVTGLANAGPALGELSTVAGDLAAARLGKLGDRLRAVTQASDAHTRAAAWATAWAGAGLVRTRLLKPQVLEVGDVLALPQAPNVVFPRPQGDLEGMEGLLLALQGPDSLLRSYAAGRLAAFGDGAVPGLMEVQRTCGRCIRFLAIETLGRIGTGEALAGLVSMLGDDDVARPLATTLLGLGLRVVEPVAAALFEIQGDKRQVQDRRRTAARILWRLRAGESLQPYLNDYDEWVKGYAQAAVWPGSDLAQRAEQGDPAGLPAALTLFEQRRFSVQALVDLLDSVPKSQLPDATAALGHTAAEEPVLAHYLVQMADGRPKEQDRAATTIMWLANPLALPVLLVWLDRRPDLVLDALPEPADSSAIWPLIEVAEQRAPRQRDPVAFALGRIGDPAAVPALLQILREAPSQANQGYAEKALIAIGAPAAESVGQALLELEPAQSSLAPALERILSKIRTLEAKAALTKYRAGTDELTRLLGHLADGKDARQAIGRIAKMGAEALEPLLDMLVGGASEGTKNAALALASLAPVLSEEQRQRAVAVLTEQLRAQQPYRTTSIVAGYVGHPLVPGLVEALCQLGAEPAAPEIRSALLVQGVGQGIVKRWQRLQEPWLLELLADGIRSLDTRLHTLQVMLPITPNAVVLERLWPPVEAVMQSETDVQILGAAMACLRVWADPRAFPLLQALKRRWATVTGWPWYKTMLGQELDEMLAEMGKKRSLLDRLRGK
jgi:HEAT repeat protein